MQSLRQLGGGVIIAIVSVILVLGGISLSLAENLPALATPTQIPPTFPQSFPTPTPTLFAIESPTGFISPSPTSPLPTDTLAVFPTVVSLPSASVSCTPPSGWIRVTTRAGDTIYSLAQRYKTSAESLTTANCLTSTELSAGFVLFVPPVPTVVVAPCYPPSTWVKAYVVQPGDTLYRIALLYGLTYPQLQRGNCMGTSTTVYSGQRLWVPNIVPIPTRTSLPAITLIPEFPTDTPFPTATNVPPTDVPAPTSSPLPTATTLPTATITAFPTQ